MPRIDEPVSSAILEREKEKKKKQNTGRDPILQRGQTETPAANSCWRSRRSRIRSIKSNHRLAFSESHLVTAPGIDIVRDIQIAVHNLEL